MLISNFDKFKNHIIQILKSELSSFIRTELETSEYKIKIEYSYGNLWIEFDIVFDPIVNEKVRFILNFYNHFQFKYINPATPMYSVEIYDFDIEYSNKLLLKINGNLESNLSKFDSELLNQVLEFDLNSILLEFEKKLFLLE